MINANAKRYFGNWSDHASMAASFIRAEWNYETSKYEERPLPEDFPKDNEVIFAVYTYEDYSGSADIIYTRDGKLFEVQAGHCSCNGLEECSYKGNETTVEALALRVKEMETSYGYLNRETDEIRNAFKALIQDQVTGESVLKSFHGVEN